MHHKAKGKLCFTTNIAFIFPNSNILLNFPLPNALKKNGWKAFITLKHYLSEVWMGGPVPKQWFESAMTINHGMLMSQKLFCPRSLHQRRALIISRNTLLRCNGIQRTLVIQNSFLVSPMMEICFQLHHSDLVFLSVLQMDCTWAEVCSTRCICVDYRFPCMLESWGPRTVKTWHF